MWRAAARPLCSLSLSTPCASRGGDAVVVRAAVPQTVHNDFPRAVPLYARRRWAAEASACGSGGQARHFCPQTCAISTGPPPGACAASPSSVRCQRRCNGGVVASQLVGSNEELDSWACSETVQVHIYSRPAHKSMEPSFMMVPGDRSTEAPPGWSVHLCSVAGVKGPGVLNQDSFSYTHLVSGLVIAIACDGHGEQGEIISGRVSRTIPLLFAQQIAASVGIEEALSNAFVEAQCDLERNLSEEQVYSGTTVAACCVDLGAQEVYFANAGDSRIILGDLTNANAVFSSDDHKAHFPGEAARLKDAGAQVIQKRYSDGEVISRVFIPRTGVPGLAMSRSLGDGCLKEYGVTAEPDVIKISGLWHECGEPVVVVASDGLWDTISEKEAIKALTARRKAKKDVRLGAEVLCRRAQRLWIEAEEDYADDTTVLLMGPFEPPVVSDTPGDSRKRARR